MDVYRGVIVHGYIRTCVKLFDISFAMVYTRAFNFVFKQLFFFLYKRGLLIINLKIKTYFLFHIGYDLFLKKSDWFNEIFMIYKMYVYGE